LRSAATRFYAFVPFLAQYFYFFEPFLGRFSGIEDDLTVNFTRNDPFRHKNSL